MPTKILIVLDVLEIIPRGRLKWLELQTQVWPHKTQVSGYNRRAQHFYLLTGATDGISLANIERAQFEFKQKSVPIVS